MATKLLVLVILCSAFVYVSAQGVTYYGTSNVRDQSRPQPHSLTLHPSSEYNVDDVPRPVYVPPPPVAYSTSPGLVHPIPSNGFQPNPVAPQPIPSSPWPGYSRPTPPHLLPPPSPPAPSPSTEPPVIVVTGGPGLETSSKYWNPQSEIVEPSLAKPALPVIQPDYRPPRPLRPPGPLLPFSPPQPITPAPEPPTIATETPRPGILDNWNPQPVISEPPPAEPAVVEPVYSSPKPQEPLEPVPSTPPPTQAEEAEATGLIFKIRRSEANDDSTPKPSSETTEESKEPTAAPEEIPEQNVLSPTELKSNSGGESESESVVIVEPEKEPILTELNSSPSPLPEAPSISAPIQAESLPIAQTRYIPGYIPTTLRPPPTDLPLNPPVRVVSPIIPPLVAPTPEPLPSPTPPSPPLTIITSEPATPPFQPTKLRDPEPIQEKSEPVENPPEPIPTLAFEPIPASTPEPTPVPAPEPIPVPALESIPASAPEPIPAPALEPIPTSAPEPIPAPALEPIPAPAPEPIPAPAPAPIPISPIPLPSPQPVYQPGNSILLVPVPAPGPSVIVSPRPPPQPFNPPPGLAPIISPTVAAESKVIVGYKCSRGNGYYSISGQCDSYVECQTNLAWRRICPDGLHFNANAKYPEYPCAYPSEVKCVGDSSKQTPQPTNECPRRYGFFPTSDGDCSKYVNCQEGKATVMSCPFGLVFNDILSSCDWPENVPQCNPYAFKGFTCPAPPVGSEGVPSDIIFKYKYGQHCRLYVACQRGYPRLLRCDPGMSFDEDSKSCIDSDLVKGCNMS